MRLLLVQNPTFVSDDSSRMSGNSKRMISTEFVRRGIVMDNDFEVEVTVLRQDGIDAIPNNAKAIVVRDANRTDRRVRCCAWFHDILRAELTRRLVSGNDWQ